MSDAAELRGVYAALPTPFADRRTIDAAALDHLLDYLLARELQGFALLTEAAEDPLLSGEERQKIIKQVAARVKGKRPFIVQISAPSSAEAVELIRFAEGKGASGFVLAIARVPGFGYREVYRQVDRVRQSTQLPMVLADRPDNALRSLEVEELTALIGHSSLSGVFAAHAEPDELKTWLERFRGKKAISLLAGCSLAMSSSVAAGATGVICGAALLAPDHAARLWKAIEKGDETQVRAIEGELHGVAELLGPAPEEAPAEGVKKLTDRIARRSLAGRAVPSTVPFSMIKEGLKMQGHPIRPEVRPPYENLRPELVARLKNTLKRGGLIS